MSGLDQLGNGDYLSFECASFIRDYLPQFRGNFAEFCSTAKAAPRLPVSAGLYAEKLYLAMFNQHPARNKLLLDRTIEEFILGTLDAEPVLLKTWMRMINDFVDVLENTSASTTSLLELVEWIDQVSRSLYHAYFRISQNTVDETPWTEDDRDESQRLVAALAGGGADDADGDGGPALTARCYFRGIEVECLLRTGQIEDDRLHCAIERRHAAIMSRVSHVLLSAADGAAALASVMSTDVDGGTTMLHRLRPIPRAGDRRDGVRVEPATPMDIHITHAGGQARGIVIDVSERHLSVYLRNTGVDLASEIRVRLDLALPTPSAATTTFEGTAVVNAVRSDPRADPRAHILVLRVEPTPNAPRPLAQYVAHRQTEILREIRHIMEGRA
jgi:hypothetical protein